MMDKFRFCLMVYLLLSYFILFPSRVWAQEYVLPYPSFMPGHPFYNIQNFIDTIQEFYSFGSFSKFKYHLGMADKKLVEAKTLFEYRQYLLASQALPQYESHLRRANYYLGQAKNEGKNISQKSKILKNATAKHRQVLERLEKELPEQFLWQPEKDKPQVIEIKKILNEAAKVSEVEME